MKPVERPRTLKEIALEQLRDAITLGFYQPRERLIERVLCERLEVSRTVVRECIRHLESEGLVSTIPNTGPSVASISVADAEEIYQIRGMLEGMAAAACARRPNTELVENLRAQLAIISQTLGDGDILLTLRATNLFYQHLFTRSGRLISWDLVQHLNGRISRLRAMTLATSNRNITGPSNLERVIAAIEAGDPAQAEQACHQHMQEATVIAIRLLRGGS